MPRQILEAVSVEQLAFPVFMAWLTRVPSAARFEHIPDWALYNLARTYLSASSAAWTSSRQAALNVATTLYLKHTRMLLDDVRNEEATVERRIHRALLTTGIPINTRLPLEDAVRLVCNEYRLERSISSWALRGEGGGRRFTRAAAVQLYAILRETLRPDADSEVEAMDED
jgi:hypothetical protein